MVKGQDFLPGVKVLAFSHSNKSRKLKIPCDFETKKAVRFKTRKPRSKGRGRGAGGGGGDVGIRCEVRMHFKSFFELVDMIPDSYY